MHSRQLIASLSALTLLAATLPAQTLASRLNKPPAGVEEALRERVTRFFALQSEGKFRQGESFVCKDSRDAYYDSHKTRWTSVKLISISWENSFRTGKVLLSLGTELKTLTGSIPALYPLTSVWKVENNAWCNSIPPVDATQAPSPFGNMKPGPAASGDPSAALRQAAPTSSDLERMVGVTKDELHVKSYEESTDSLEIVNGLPGPLTLVVHAPTMAGLSWTLSKSELQRREKATLTVVYKPVDRSMKTPFNLNLVVEPFGGMKAIPVVFAPPPAAKPAPAPPPAVKQ